MNEKTILGFIRVVTYLEREGCGSEADSGSSCDCDNNENKNIFNLSNKIFYMRYYFESEFRLATKP
jgi:hypothetical protein